MATYPPDWRVFLVCKKNLPDIITYGNYANEEELLVNLNTHIKSQYLYDIRCGAFNRQVIKNINDIYPHRTSATKRFYFWYLAISQKAGIIGCLGTEHYYPGDGGLFDKSVFTHISNERGIVALVAEINWTCSFTNSPVIHRGQRVKDIIKADAATHKINMGKFIADEVCKLLLVELHNHDEKMRNINRVLLVSEGTDSARVRHRKNGKLGACTFLDEWVNPDGMNIIDVYKLAHQNALIFYLYYADGSQFVGGEDYEWLKNTGSDLATIRDESLTGNSRYADTNYSCPSGITFDDIGFVINKGSPYVFNSSGKRKRGGRRISRKMSCISTTKTSSRRRTFGRSSRRRGRN